MTGFQTSRRLLPAVFLLLLLILCCSCSKTDIHRQEAETGDRIEMKLTLPRKWVSGWRGDRKTFIVFNDERFEVFRAFLVSLDTYDTLSSHIRSLSEMTPLSETDTSYFCGGTEWDYLVAIPDSSTALVACSMTSQEDAQKVIDGLSLKCIEKGSGSASGSDAETLDLSGPLSEYLFQDSKPL